VVDDNDHGSDNSFHNNNVTIIILYLKMRFYGDGAGNTTEENSSVFSLV